MFFPLTLLVKNQHEIRLFGALLLCISMLHQTGYRETYPLGFLGTLLISVT